MPPAPASQLSLGPETLYSVIGAVAHGPDLDQVLPAVVDLLVEATACHACFIYLREGDVLRMRAASPVFARAVGRVAMRLDEGLSGWVARHRQPAFIPEAALADPRVKYFPELEEERFQSMVAVPLLAGEDHAIGVVVLHTEAPREFGQEVLEFLVHVASLVAGAIDNARLFERAQRQVVGLSALNAVCQRLSALTRRDELHEAGCAGAGELLAGASARLVLIDDQRAGGVEVAAWGAEPLSGPLAHQPSAGRAVAELTDGHLVLGALEVQAGRPLPDEELALLRALATALATSLDKAALIERLATENVAHDVLEALRSGDGAAAATRAVAAGWKMGRSSVLVVGRPAEGDRVGPDVGALLDGALHRRGARGLIDSAPGSLRALVAVDPPDWRATADALVADLDGLGRAHGVSFGVAEPRSRLEDCVVALRHADEAAGVAATLSPGGGAVRFDRLGAYRFLAALPDSSALDARHRVAIESLIEYDEQRGTALLQTLERHLADRGASAVTAQALFVHPNTLRQRLQRVEELTDLRLAEDDLLCLELSIKLLRLQRSRQPPGGPLAAPGS